jgi:hypothetical protein
MKNTLIDLANSKGSELKKTSQQILDELRRHHASLENILDDMEAQITRYTNGKDCLPDVLDAYLKDVDLFVIATRDTRLQFLKAEYQLDRRNLEQLRRFIESLD